MSQLREACPACGDDVEHVWCLISPEGKRFTGATKMAAYRAEAETRIPATEQLANIMRATAECEAEYQAELEQARKEGFQAGHAAGLEQAAQKIEAHCEPLSLKGMAEAIRAMKP